MHFALLDNSCREYLFLADFFMAQNNAAKDLFTAVFGKTLSLFLVSTLCCGFHMQKAANSAFSLCNGAFAANGHMVQSPAVLESKLRTGTFKRERLHPVNPVFPLFWVSQYVACSPVWWMLYHPCDLYLQTIEAHVKY